MDLCLFNAFTEILIGLQEVAGKSCIHLDHHVSVGVLVYLFIQLNYDSLKHYMHYIFMIVYESLVTLFCSLALSGHMAVTIWKFLGITRVKNKDISRGQFTVVLILHCGEQLLGGE